MPTYNIYSSNIELTNFQKNKIASEVSQIHEAATGADSFFAQIIFHKIDENSHYLGSKKIATKQIFLHGEIREGRSEKIKNKLIMSLRDAIMNFSGVGKDCIWVYVVDLKPEQMIEYGEILPKPGKESVWFNALPVALQEKLQELK
jgi:phenylpyruvate tautomerase PptA (4-oxalocrotonate tautomerase family)